MENLPDKVQRWQAQNPHGTKFPVTLCATVFCVGPINQKVRSVLSYPAHFYSKVDDGTTVIDRLWWLETFADTNRTCMLARALGITDPLNFSEHQLDPSRFDQEALSEFSDSIHPYEASQKLKTLIDSGFNFYFSLTQTEGG